MASGRLLTQFQTQRTLDVCLQGPSLTNEASTPPRAGNGRTQGDWGTVGPAVLTAIGLVCAVLTIEVTIATPQLESAVSISTGELVRFTGWRGPCVDKAGSHGGPL